MHALHAGDAIERWETVLTVEGDDSLYCHLEAVYLGALESTPYASTGTPAASKARIRGENDFTGDVVRCDGAPAAKAGRGELPNPARRM